ncbi:hypothetical protein HPB47_010955, partial [Ixodes persulcatus]
MPNRRSNVLAKDTRSTDSTKTLLRLTSLGGIRVIAYEPFPRELAAGVIYEVPVDMIEADLQLAVHVAALDMFKLPARSYPAALAAVEPMTGASDKRTARSARTAVKRTTQHR